MLRDGDTYGPIHMASKFLNIIIVLVRASNPVTKAMSL